MKVFSQINKCHQKNKQTKQNNNNKKKGGLILRWPSVLTQKYDQILHVIPKNQRKHLFS